MLVGTASQSVARGIAQHDGRTLPCAGIDSPHAYAATTIELTVFDRRGQQHERRREFDGEAPRVTRHTDHRAMQAQSASVVRHRKLVAGAVLHAAHDASGGRSSAGQYGVGGIGRGAVDYLIGHAVARNERLETSAWQWQGRAATGARQADG